MRKVIAFTFFMVLVSLVGGATPAQAGFVIEGSVGKGGRVNDPSGWEPTNVMIAPGFSFLGILRAQLGLVADLGDVQNRKSDFQLRPMLGIYPPILPLYARAIFAFQNLRNSPRRIAVGGAVGLKIGLPFIGLGIFAEAGVLPSFGDSMTRAVVEGRVGAFWVF